MMVLNLIFLMCSFNLFWAWFWICAQPIIFFPKLLFLFSRDQWKRSNSVDNYKKMVKDNLVGSTVLTVRWKKLFHFFLNFQLVVGWGIFFLAILRRSHTMTRATWLRKWCGTRHRWTSSRRKATRKPPLPSITRSTTDSPSRTSPSRSSTLAPRRPVYDAATPALSLSSPSYVSWRAFRMIYGLISTPWRYDRILVVYWLIHWLIDFWIEWLVIWCSHCSIDWLIDRLWEYSAWTDFLDLVLVHLTKSCGISNPFGRVFFGDLGHHDHDETESSEAIRVHHGIPAVVCQYGGGPRSAAELGHQSRTEAVGSARQNLAARWGTPHSSNLFHDNFIFHFWKRKISQFWFHFWTGVEILFKKGNLKVFFSFLQKRKKTKIHIFLRRFPRKVFLYVFPENWVSSENWSRLFLIHSVWIIKRNLFLLWPRTTGKMFIFKEVEFCSKKMFFSTFILDFFPFSHRDDSFWSTRCAGAVQRGLDARRHEQTPAGRYAVDQLDALLSETRRESGQGVFRYAAGSGKSSRHQRGRSAYHCHDGRHEHCLRQRGQRGRRYQQGKRLYCFTDPRSFFFSKRISSNSLRQNWLFRSWLN